MTTRTPARFAAHPVIEHPRPAVQVTPAGPGRISWRVYDAAAPAHIRDHEAYAWGAETYPADMRGSGAATKADRAARQRAEEALAEVRQLIAARQRRQATAPDDQGNCRNCGGTVTLSAVSEGHYVHHLTDSRACG
ncbi:MAG TPA: hypothetical protein VFQ44_01705 [Streptosporangiaceae bacterium]|nr:hypothetical protein [Streptosporangiaceae bacterium]